MTVNGLTCPFTDLDYNLELCPDENNLVMVGCIVLLRHHIHGALFLN